MHIDPNRIFYHQLGLKRHCLIISPYTICKYSTEYLETGTLPRGASAGEDIFHEGGDFIISRSGKVEYAYVADEMVRPTVMEILGCLKKLHK